MSQKRYTESEVNAMVAEIEQGLSDEQVAARKAEIERKYGLSPGALGNFKLSTGEEAEKAAIFRPHYEATQAEVDAMSMDEYLRWRELGYHLKKSPEEQQLDAEAEARDRVRAAELALIDGMSVEQYHLYQEGKALKAQGEKEAAAKLTEKERQDKLNALRRKNPEDMTMEEYAQWVELRDRR